MLLNIINECRKAGGTVSLSELSNHLGIERNALAGMLDTLVRQGKLYENSDTGKCSSCKGTCAGCMFSKENNQNYKVYSLAGNFPD